MLTAQFAESPDSERQTVNVKKEAIMAAGSIHTPQILQLSGIGDKDQLEKHGIDVVANVPGVGNNLQDHLYVPTVFSCEWIVTRSDKYG